MVAKAMDGKLPQAGGELPLVFGDGAAQGRVRTCEVVNVPTLSDSTCINFAPGIPTLILSGRLDAQTPAFRNEEVKTTLSSAQLFVFPCGSHVQPTATNICAP